MYDLVLITAQRTCPEYVQSVKCTYSQSIHPSNRHASTIMHRHSFMPVHDMDKDSLKLPTTIILVTLVLIISILTLPS